MKCRKCLKFEIKFAVASIIYGIASIISTVVESRWDKRVYHNSDSLSDYDLQNSDWDTNDLCDNRQTFVFQYVFESLFSITLLFHSWYSRKHSFSHSCKNMFILCLRSCQAISWSPTSLSKVAPSIWGPLATTNEWLYDYVIFSLNRLYNNSRTGRIIRLIYACRGLSVDR